MLTLPRISAQYLDVRMVDAARLPGLSYMPNPGELEALIGLIRSARGHSVIVEFGVNEGRTAEAILQSLPLCQRYIGIDVFQGYVPVKPHQLKEVPARPGHICLHDPRFMLILRKRGSHDLAPSDFADCDADVAFIDGDHSRAGVLHDTAIARSIVRPGGLIIWHDYNDEGRCDVREVLHEFRNQGRTIVAVENTWLAFERVNH